MGYISLKQLKKKDLIKLIEDKNEQIRLLNRRIEYLTYLADFYRGDKKPHPERFFEYLNGH